MLQLRAHPADFLAGWIGEKYPYIYNTYIRLSEDKMAALDWDVRPYNRICSADTYVVLFFLRRQFRGL